MMKAFLTQDVATFKRLSAKRTLQLVSLTFEAAREDSQYKQELANRSYHQCRPVSGLLPAGHGKSVSSSRPALARSAPPDARLTTHPSLSSADSEARIAAGNSEVARARLVGKEWKIDLTDWLKRGVLAEVKDPQMRARIKSL